MKIREQIRHLLIVFAICVCLGATGARAQSVNNGLSFPLVNTINAASQAAFGFTMPASMTNGVGNCILNTLNSNGTVGGINASGTSSGVLQWEGNQLGASVSWNFSTDSTGQIVVNITFTAAGLGIFSPKSQSHTLNVPTGVSGGLLNGTTPPSVTYPIISQSSGNSVNGQNYGSGYTYTLQVLVAETWDGTNLTDYVVNYTYFIVGGGRYGPPVAPN